MTDHDFNMNGSTHRPRAGRRGAVVVLVSAALVLFAAMAVLTIDLGWVYIQEARLRRGVNAAAIAAANQAFGSGSTAQIQQSAKNFAQTAGLALDNGDIQIDPMGNNRSLVRIGKTGPVSLFFGQLFGARSTSIGYDVYALASQDTTLLYSSPLAPFAPCAVVPVYIPHADLYPVLKGTVVTKAGLAALIFDATRHFNPGQRYLLKTGQRFKVKIQDISGMGSSQQGSLVLPGQTGGANGWQTCFQAGFGGRVGVGDVLATEPGTIQGPVQSAVTFRVGQDPGGSFTAGSKTALPLSARMVVVPIANANVGGPADADTEIPNLRNVGYIWNGAISVRVIGFAQFYLDPYATDEGRGVITGSFIGYVGTPPKGQDPG